MPRSPLTTAPLALENAIPVWPDSALEPVPACPFCRNPERTPLYGGLRDITFFNTSGPFSMVSCAQCHAGYLDPRPTPAAIGAAYRRYYTHTQQAGATGRNRNLKSRIRHGLANDYRRAQYKARTGLPIFGGRWLLKALPASRSILDSYYRYLPATKGTLLDFGCGNGGFLRIARNELEWDVEGVDFDRTAVETARAEGFAVHRGGAEVLDRWDARFDAVTLSHVIEHVHSPQQLVRAIWQVLRPGGFLFVETPNMNALAHRIFGPYWRGLEVPRHLGIPTYAALTGLLENCGFIDVRARPRRDVFAPMYKRSAALSEGASSEDPACLSLPGPPHDSIRALAENPLQSEYVTLTAIKPRAGATDGIRAECLQGR